MKKIAIILSAILTASMAVPSITDATDSPHHYQAIIDAYLNGEYDWDFNFDGEVNSIDAHCILVRTSELATSSEKNYMPAYYIDDNNTKQYYQFTPHMRAKVNENGDINKDGYINFVDSSIVLQVLSYITEKGDINTDGMLDAKDASAILEYYSANSTDKPVDSIVHDKMEMFGDINGDGIVNASDASYVLSEYSKRATE